MGEVSTIGLDIAKSVFQVHGVDGSGAVVMRKRIGRSKVLEFFGGLSPCLVGIELKQISRSHHQPLHICACGSVELFQVATNSTLMRSGSST
jgi:transposase